MDKDRSTRDANRVGMACMLLANGMLTLGLNATPSSGPEQTQTVYIGVAIVLFFGGFWLYLQEDWE